MTTLVLEAEIDTIDSTVVAAQTVVARPPSSIDTSGFITVYIGGAATLRRYDDELEQP